MSAYDVQIGKLISGIRELEGSGQYIVCTPDKKIRETDTITSEDGVFVSAQDVEDALYAFCLTAMDNYIAEGNNRDVYTFSIGTDPYHGSYVVYINNMESLKRSVEEAMDAVRKRQSSRDADEDQTRSQLTYELKYAEADYPFLYADWPEQLKQWLHLYACVTMEQPDWLEVDQPHVFEKQLFDSQLFLLAIRVVHRLQHDFARLDRTRHFIAYVSAGDGVGGDWLTSSQLIRRCVSQQQLYEAMPDVKKMDEAYEASVRDVEHQPLHEQVAYWTAVTEKGEFDPGSPYQFNKTDFETYEQLMRLGQAAVPFLQEQLKGALAPDTRFLLQTVLDDLAETTFR